MHLVMPRVALVAALMGALAVLLSGCAGATEETAREVPVYLVPMGDVKRSTIAAAKLGVQRSDPTLIAQVPGMVRIPSDAFDGEQVVAERALAALSTFATESGLEPGATVIGLTPADMRIARRPEWRWAFSLREGSRAIVATGRFDDRRYGLPKNPTAFQRRVVTAVGRNVAFLTLGARQTDDPACINGPAPGGIDELDALGAKVCQ